MQVPNTPGHETALPFVSNRMLGLLPSKTKSSRMHGINENSSQNELSICYSGGIFMFKYLSIYTKTTTCHLFSPLFHGISPTCVFVSGFISKYIKLKNLLNAEM
jgi:hypothetical protein